MGRAGRQRVEREFSRERMITNYTQMYEMVARGELPVVKAAAGPRPKTATALSGDVR